jgi:AmmeMemoRadiSam system protein B
MVGMGVFALHVRESPTGQAALATPAATATERRYATSTIRFFEAPGFYDAVRRFPRETTSKIGRGVVVPHHLVADDLIAETLARVGDQEISQIVLIGPNHFELGNAPVTTSNRAWVSPIGVVVPDHTLIDALVAQTTYVKNDPLVMEQEHGHASVMPFLSYYFPNVPVTPLALSMKLTREELSDLATRLAARDDGTTLYVATIDFSHYLSAAEARERDQKTAELIRTKNTEGIMMLNSQYLDSPRSLVLLMEVLDQLGYHTPVIHHTSNTADYLYDYHGEVTSYFSISFIE